MLELGIVTLAASKMHCRQSQSPQLLAQAAEQALQVPPPVAQPPSAAAAAMQPLPQTHCRQTLRRQSRQPRQGRLQAAAAQQVLQAAEELPALLQARPVPQRGCRRQRHRHRMPLPALALLRPVLLLLLVQAAPRPQPQAR